MGARGAGYWLLTPAPLIIGPDLPPPAGGGALGTSPPLHNRGMLTALFRCVACEGELETTYPDSTVPPMHLAYPCPWCGAQLDLAVVRGRDYEEEL